MKRLKWLVLITAVNVIICGICLFAVYGDNPVIKPEIEPVNYQIVIYEGNGAAQVEVFNSWGSEAACVSLDNAGYLFQTQEDLQLKNGDWLLAGTLIIPGDGDKVFYEYPRRETVKGDN